MEESKRITVSGHWTHRLIDLLMKLNLYPRSTALVVMPTSNKSQPIGIALVDGDKFVFNHYCTLGGVNMTLDRAREVANNILSLCDQRETWGKLNE